MPRDYEIIEYARVNEIFCEFTRKLSREIFLTQTSSVELAKLLSWDYNIEFFSVCINGGIVPKHLVQFVVSRVRRLGRVVRDLKRVIKEDAVLEWLKKPNRALGDKSPKELLSSHEGTTKIIALIEQVESGSFS